MPQHRLLYYLVECICTITTTAVLNIYKTLFSNKITQYFFHVLILIVNPLYLAKK